jgi:hypothetical protein
MKKALMIIGVVAVLAIGAFVAFFLIAKAELKPYAEQVVVACDEGRYEDVYKDAAPAFRESTSMQAFREYAEMRRKALGRFRRVGSTTGTAMSSSTSGPSTGEVSMDLEYENGTAKGQFQFLKDGDTWRLTHLKIAFDEKLMPGPDRAALEPLSRELLALYDRSEFVALYARFSEPLQEAWKAEEYEPQIRDLRAKTGRLVSATVRETKDEGGGKMRLSFDATFEAAGAGDATFGWVWANGQWNLLAFNLHVGPR